MKTFASLCRYVLRVLMVVANVQPFVIYAAFTMFTAAAAIITGPAGSRYPNEEESRQGAVHRTRSLPLC